jgi:DNA-binding transcriptional LysR family regulator
MRMELRQLVALEAVLETGTFAAAARLRGLAQPALWMQVKTLERELGVPLFERDGRRVRPTRAALLLRARARLVVDDAHALSALAGEIRLGRAAPARIGCAEYHVPHFLAGCIARLRRQHPDSPLPVIVPLTTATAAESLRRGDVDLAVAMGDLDAEVEGARLYPVYLAMVKRRLRGGDVDVRALDRQPLATMPRDSAARATLDEACAAAGVTPLIVHEHRNASTLLAFARHGLAAAVLVSEALTSDEERRAARLCAGRRRLEGTLWLQWHRDRTLPTTALQLREIMLAEARRRVSDSRRGRPG